MLRRADLDELERSLASVARLLSDRSMLGDIAQRAGHDLPPASWALLEHLDALGPMRVSDIAVCHGVDVSSVTPRLQVMQNAGLVTRAKLAGDGRVWMIQIAAKGSEALASVHAARRSILADVLADADAAEVTAASMLLARITERLTRQPTR